MNNLLAIADISSAMVENLMTLGVWYYVILNAFGVVAIILKVTEFQLNNRSVILTFALSAAACWVAYFILQGDFVSALTCAIGVVQGLIFLQRGKHKWADSKFWLFFFLIIQITSGVIFFKEWHDIFATLAGVFNVLAYFVLDKKKYRLLGFICLFWWVMNSAFKFYPIAFANDLFGCISAFVAIIRYDVIKKTNEQQLNEGKTIKTETTIDN